MLIEWSTSYALRVNFLHIVMTRNTNYNAHMYHLYTHNDCTINQVPLFVYCYLCSFFCIFWGTSIMEEIGRLEAPVT